MFFNNSNDSILFNFTTIISSDNNNSSSSNNNSLTLMLMTPIQYYAILIFFFICFIFVLFLFLFVYNLFCLLLKSFKCCQNDSFYFICDTLNRNHNQAEVAAGATTATSFLGPISSSSLSSSLTNSEKEIRNNRLSLEVVVENKNNNTNYGILNNYSNKTPLLRNDEETELSTLPAAKEQQKKLKESSDFYSTFTFKSFKTLETNELTNNNNNDYLDICNTLENVTKSINKELELIENINLSKISITNNTEIVGEAEEEEEEENIKTNETEKLITDLLPMPDLSSITDLNNDETNLDSSIQDIDNYSDILVVKD